MICLLRMKGKAMKTFVRLLVSVNYSVYCLILPIKLFPSPLQIYSASSYWSIYPETSNMDTLLPYSSLLTWDTEIPGITLVTEEIPLPLMKVHSFKGYWEKLNANLEYVKYSKPHLHYNNSMVRREWLSLISEEKTRKRRSMVYVRNILDNAMKVISNLEARSAGKKRPVMKPSGFHTIFCL